MANVDVDVDVAIDVADATETISGISELVTGVLAIPPSPPPSESKVTPVGDTSFAVTATFSVPRTRVSVVVAVIPRVCDVKLTSTSAEDVYGSTCSLP